MVEWRKLGEIIYSITTGLNPRKNFVLNDTSAVLTSWYITTKDYSQNEKIEIVEGKTAKISEEARIKINQRSKLEKNDLLFSAVGTVGKVVLVDIEPSNFDVNESTFVLKPKQNIVNGKFLLYFLKTNAFRKKLMINLRGSTLSGIRKADLENFQIPIPPLEVQEHIVSILDKLDTLVNSFKEGLPREIELRKKQYEYYRERLLDFKK